MRRSTPKKRIPRGSAISEMGPALFILLMMIFFPMLNLIGLGCSYCSCLYLNHQQTKQAAIVKASEATLINGPVRQNLPQQWIDRGLGKFVKPTVFPTTSVTYRDGQQDPITKITDKFVRVNTTVQCNPFVTIPFWYPVPGLSAPMTFTLSSEAPVENPDNAG